MKKAYFVLIVIIVILFAWFVLRFWTPEDSWIKDERGLWVKHGAPSEIPDYVAEQQEVIECAFGLYQEKKNSGMNFSSQCLGTCRNYAVDIVHVPRNEEDNLVENQCEDYREGKVHKFIELDKDGNIVRVT